MKFIIKLIEVNKTKHDKRNKERTKGIENNTVNS